MHMHTNMTYICWHTEHIIRTVAPILTCTTLCIYTCFNILIFSCFRLFIFSCFLSFLLSVLSGSESFDPFGALRKMIFNPPVSMNAIGERWYHPLLFITAWNISWCDKYKWVYSYHFLFFISYFILQISFFLIYCIVCIVCVVCHVRGEAECVDGSA